MSNNTLNQKALYNTVTQLVIHAASTNWNRFYYYLVGITILILGWIALFTNVSLYYKSLLIIISLFGVGMSLIWMCLAHRERAYLRLYLKLGCELEKGRKLEKDEVPEEKEEIHPFCYTMRLNANKEVREVSIPCGSCWARSKLILWLIPIIYAALFLILLVISFRI